MLLAIRRFAECCFVIIWGARVRSVNLAIRGSLALRCIGVMTERYPFWIRRSALGKALRVALFFVYEDE